MTTFINAEDQNFALFNYVNELNSECEKLEEQITDIRSHDPHVIMTTRH